MNCLTILLLLNSCFGVGNGPSFQSGKEPPSHEQWDQLVKKHVMQEGWVDYEGFISDSEELNAYLETLSNTPPDNDSWSKAEKLAYWINVYNAFTVKLITENYPVESIKDIGPTVSIPTVNDVFEGEFIKIGDRDMSLNTIEHGILRAMNEPRIHFAVNCASVSCPKLRNEAYTAEKIESQLQEQANYFLNESGENILSKDRVVVSKIFFWFTEDFTRNGSLIDFINKHSDLSIDQAATVEYKEYDWRLNSIKKKELQLRH